MSAGMIFFMVGCSTVGVTKIANSPNFPAKPDNCDIQVFMNSQEIHRKYVELCEIDVRTGTSIFNDTSAQGAIKEAKPKACEQGCDAIIVDSAGTGYVTRTRGAGMAFVRGIKFVGPDPGNPVLAKKYFEAGNSDYKAGNYPEAISYLNAAVKLYTNYWQAYQLLAFCYYKQNDVQNCMVNCDLSLGINPDNASLKGFDDKLKNGTK